MIKSKNPSQHTTPYTGGTKSSLRRCQMTLRRSRPRDIENAIPNNLLISWKMIIIPLDEEVGDEDE